LDLAKKLGANITINDIANAKDEFYDVVVDCTGVI